MKVQNKKSDFFLKQQQIMVLSRVLQLNQLLVINPTLSVNSTCNGLLASIDCVDYLQLLELLAVWKSCGISTFLWWHIPYLTTCIQPVLGKHSGAAAEHKEQCVFGHFTADAFTVCTQLDCGYLRVLVSTVFAPLFGLGL